MLFRDPRDGKRLTTPPPGGELDDEPACSITLAVSPPSNRTVSLDDLVQWSVDAEPVSTKQTMLAGTLRKTAGKRLEWQPRNVILGPATDGGDKHHANLQAGSTLVKVNVGCQSDSASICSVSCQTSAQGMAEHSIGCQAGQQDGATPQPIRTARQSVDVGCQTRQPEELDTTQVTDARMWARIRLVVNFIDQLSVSMDATQPRRQPGSEASKEEVMPTEAQLRASAYARLRCAKVTKRSICILLVIARELGLLLYTDAGDEEDWRSKIQLGLRATLCRMERRPRYQRVQILGDVTRACLDAQFGGDDLRTIVFGCLTMAPRHLPVVYTRRSSYKPAQEDGMSTSSDEEFEPRRHPSARAIRPAAVASAQATSRTGLGRDEEQDNSSQLLSDESTAPHDLDL